MEYIYIDNYIKLSKEKKINFLKFLDKFSSFNISNQNIIFSEESIILEFMKGSNINDIYTSIKDYFKSIEYIKVDTIQKTFNKSNNTVLTFKGSNKKIII